MRTPLTLAEILAVLNDQRSVPELQAYFGLDGGTPRTGNQFERLGGSGDRPEVRNVITAEDLIAIELLSVRVPPQTALDLLQGRLGRDVSAQLAVIPTDVGLGDEGALAHVDEKSHADRAWRLLKRADGIGWVIAGKLLARKRPMLVPVYDEIVSCAFGTRKKFWRWLHGRLREDKGVLVERLTELQIKARVPEEVSQLRILDVVFWMRHRSQHKGYRCRGLRPPNTDRSH
ncbi:DUF6308 family protein [Micromonospora auratinigra]|uniref:Uncharacterized protein n=1 Tax=Micromonospora auratinigra TaxID=261654 RepID=A0A1A8ZA21_9ACTN|nr:DUF6308 family protein [Micromonospora auratinigra]SBT40680.1 hypothetical protein GA0070611_1344 [Micromonospora auratinigra]